MINCINDFLSKESISESKIPEMLKQLIKLSGADYMQLAVHRDPDRHFQNCCQASRHTDPSEEFIHGVISLLTTKPDSELPLVIGSGLIEVSKGKTIKSDYQQLICIPVNESNIRIGVLVVGFLTFKQLTDYQSVGVIDWDTSKYSDDDVEFISDLNRQISTAVTTILAHQLLIQSEQEKSKLLRFSNELASERDILILCQKLKSQFKELFSIGDFLAVTALSEDKKSHRVILYDPDAPISKHPYLVHVINNYVVFHQEIFGLILKSNGPVLFDTNKWADMNLPPAYAKMIPEFGIDNMIGTAIRFAGEPIGFLVFKQDTLLPVCQQAQLFESICSQLAIVLSNILANQKIETQLKQIKAYKEQLEDEKLYLKEEIDTMHSFNEIIGASHSLRETFRLVDQVASSDSTVLILGETGTGKELIARAIHNNSKRKAKLMVKVNCAALPANLIESELFGHERGSFTGATDRRLGKFELANGGTLFLDEIGEMPLDLQVKLLRVLQEREIERVGGRTTIKIDTRIIAATNRDLEKDVQDGRFRSDLYYRLNIFPITLPPLRERKDDIELLATHFINKFSKKTGKKINSLGTRVLEELIAYPWPGNIRELEHLIERSVLLASGPMIKQIDLPSLKSHSLAKAITEEIKLQTIDENEKAHIYQILKYCKGRVSGHGAAAEILGVPPSTLNSKIKRLGITREHLV